MTNISFPEKTFPAFLALGKLAAMLGAAMHRQGAEQTRILACKEPNAAIAMRAWMGLFLQ